MESTVAEGTALRNSPDYGRNGNLAREYAPEIADIVTKYTKFNGRRKPELLDPDTFSLVNYQEADRVLAEWKSITDEAERNLSSSCRQKQRDAFFETCSLSGEGLGASRPSYTSR